MTEQKSKTEKQAEKTVIKKKFNGTVVSAKSDKTLIVSVNRVKIHPKYKKRYNVSKKYKVHDEKNFFKEGAEVSFVECRPLSKDKKWRVIYV
jgi:small subunit ribosomal protein S17